MPLRKKLLREGGAVTELINLVRDELIEKVRRIWFDKLSEEEQKR